MKYLILEDKLITLFDVVKLTHENFRKDLFTQLEKVNDYRIVLSHGVIGELLYFLNNNGFGLDAKKIFICSNNIETVSLFNKNNYRIYNISEYIFLDDDFFNIKDIPKEIECIFPGREAKNYDLFLTPQSEKIFVLNKLKNYPISRNELSILYNKSYTGLMTTEQEGSCLSVGEMLLSGLPIVSVKINNNYPPSSYYPERNGLSFGCYDVVSRNTLGGRELWLNGSNSIYCERDILSIIKSIEDLKNRMIDSKDIRSDFISLLNYNRRLFLYLISSIFDELKLDLSISYLEKFINLPYSNNTLNSTGWNEVKNTFNNSTNEKNNYS